jgi:hypothetical protein
MGSDEWYALASGFLAIELVEGRFANKPIAAKLDADERKALDSASATANEGANTLRGRQGLEEFARF